MKKIMLGLFAMTLMSTTGVFAADKGKKKTKAKTCCAKPCPETKDCKKNAKCSAIPGCVCP